MMEALVDQLKGQINLMVGDHHQSSFKPTLDQISGLILHNATDNQWPIEIFIFDFLCSIFLLTLGFFWVKTPQM